MARQESIPLSMSRRSFLKAGGPLAAGLALSAVGAGMHEQIKGKSKEKPLTETQQNLESALELMDAYDHQLVKDAFDFYKSDQNQIVQFMTSESEKRLARVIPSTDGQQRTVIIALERIQFSDKQFNIREAAISLFEAYYVYQLAKSDPRTFSRLSAYRASLEHDAESISSQIFSQK